jgi:hypothetical protein
MRGVVPSFLFAVLVAASREKPSSAFQKWKMHFLWDEMKIRLYGLPRHPKVYAHIRYGLVLTNYAMIRAKPSSFDLKAI